MIIDKNSEYIKLAERGGEHWYVYENKIDTDEDIVIELDYPICFKKSIQSRGQIKSNISILAHEDIESKNGVKIKGALEVYGCVGTTGDIEVGDCLETDGCVEACGDIKVGSHLSVCDSGIYADGNIIVKDYISVNDSVRAGGNLVCSGDINVGGKVVFNLNKWRKKNDIC